jgi:uncharacterized lipoprotein YajG
MNIKKWVASIKYRSGIVLFLLYCLSCCAQNQLVYHIAPELESVKWLLNNKSLIFIDVVDIKKNKATLLNEIKGSQPDAKAIKKELIRTLKKHHFKVINRSLLADIGIKIVIKELYLKLDPGVLKSQLEAESRLEFVINQKSNVWRKTFYSKRKQAFANPVTDLEASGMINQVLSELFTQALNEPSLKIFLTP